MKRKLEKICHAFKLKIANRELSKIVSKIESVRRGLSIGRIPSSNEELFALFLARKISATNHIQLPHCEIGSLFGGSAIITDYALNGNGKQILVDPLDGFYGQNIDPISGELVNLKNLKTKIFLMA